MWLWELIRGGSRGKRGGRSAVARASVVTVDSMESRCRGWVAPCRYAEPATPVPAICEPLEHRIHLTTTFHSYMSAAISGRTVTVILWTTGGKASQYVVYWNDTNSGGSVSQTFTGPTDGSPLTKSYTYHGAYTGPITSVATLSGSSTTATAYYALDGSFGTFQASGTGATRWNPNGNTGSVGQTSALVDTIGGSFDTLLGDLFVAHSYYPSGGGGPLFAVTAFANGQFDSRFGTINGTTANNDTYVVPSFGGGSDIPLGITVAKDGDSGVYLIVVGKCARGWAMCEINTEQTAGLTGTYGNAVWNIPSGSGTFDSGQANAAVVDTTDNDHFFVVGTDGTHMAVGNLEVGDGSPFGSSWGTKGVITVPFTNPHSSFTDNYALGNSVLEVDDATTASGEEIVVAGTTCYACGTGCNAITGSDFTVVEINQDTASVDKNLRTNVGFQQGRNSLSPSTDAGYGIVGYNDGTNTYVTAVGQTNYWGSDYFTMEQYNYSTGALVSTFGQYSGIAKGPAGDAYAAFTPLDSTTGEIWVTGASGGDMLTAAFTGSGSLESSGSSAWGNAGLWYQDLGDSASTNNSTDIGWCMVPLYQSDGTTLKKLLVCGTTIPNGQTKTQIALAQYTPTNQVTIA